MKGYLKKLNLVQLELVYGAMFSEVDHEILYDPDTRIAIDITEDAPGTERYGLVSDEGIKLIEDFLSGKEKPIQSIEEIERHSIIYFESTRLEGEKYTPIRASMIALKNTYKTYEKKKSEMEEYCKKLGLVKVDE